MKQGSWAMVGLSELFVRTSKMAGTAQPCCTKRSCLTLRGVEVMAKRVVNMAVPSILHDPSCRQAPDALAMGELILGERSVDIHLDLK
jgi:hypothetical protein